QLLLHVVGVVDDYARRAGLVHGRVEGRRAADAGDLLDHDHSREGVRPLATALLRDVDRIEPRFVQRLEGLLREALIFIDILCVRGDVALREAADGFAQLLVLLWELEWFEVRVESHRSPPQIAFRNCVLDNYLTL